MLQKTRNNDEDFGKIAGIYWKAFLRSWLFTCERKMLMIVEEIVENVVGAGDENGTEELKTEKFKYVGVLP